MKWIHSSSLFSKATIQVCRYTSVKNVTQQPHKLNRSMKKYFSSMLSPFTNSSTLSYTLSCRSLVIQMPPGQEKYKRERWERRRRRKTQFKASKKKKKKKTYTCLFFFSLLLLYILLESWYMHQSATGSKIQARKEKQGLRMQLKRERKSQGKEGVLNKEQKPQ